MSTVTRALLALTLALSPVLLPVGAAGAHPGTVHTVRPGQSIQAALAAARPGDTVLVRAGTYRENLEITTDRVTLIGDGARLQAPEVPTPRRCSVAFGIPQNVHGICIAGELGPGVPPTVVRPVRDVTIRGLTVGRFPSTGIVAFGADGVRIAQSDIAGGTNYGILLSHSSGSEVIGNRLHGASVSGVYIGDSPQARATVRGNRVYDNGFYGVFVRNASTGTISANDIHDNCIGVGLRPNAPEQDAVSDWTVHANRIHHNTGFCDLGEEPHLTGIGVLLAGTQNVDVAYNVIDHNAVDDRSVPTRGGGVVLESAAEAGGPAQPRDNRVRANWIHANHPADLVVLTAGSGNRLPGNLCRISSPAGLC